MNRVKIKEFNKKLWKFVDCTRIYNTVYRQVNWLSAVFMEEQKGDTGITLCSPLYTEIILRDIYNCLDEKFIDRCVIDYIDLFFRKLVETSVVGESLAIKACDPKISGRAAKILAGERHLLRNINTVADALNIFTVKGIRVDQKTSTTAVKLLEEEFGLHGVRPYESIWYLLNEIWFLGMETICEYRVDLLRFISLVITGKCDLGELLNLPAFFEHVEYKSEFNLHQGWDESIREIKIKRQFSNRRHQLKVWNEIALEVLELSSEEAEKLLNDNWSCKNRGLFPFLLLEQERKHAISLVKSVQLNSLMDFYSIFILGARFRQDKKTKLVNLIGIPREKLKIFVGFFNDDTIIFKSQVQIPYLNLFRLFKIKNPNTKEWSGFDGEYAQTLTDNEETKKMIRLVSSKICFPESLFLQVPFLMYEGMHWDREVSRHYHYLINCLLIATANTIEKNNAKDILCYLGLKGEQFHLLRSLEHYAAIECTLDKVKYQFQMYQGLFIKTIIGSMLDVELKWDLINSLDDNNLIDEFAIEASILNDLDMERFDCEEYAKIKLWDYTENSLFTEGRRFDAKSMINFSSDPLALQEIQAQANCKSDNLIGQKLITSFLRFKKFSQPSPLLAKFTQLKISNDPFLAKKKLKECRVSGLEKLLNRNGILSFELSQWIVDSYYVLGRLSASANRCNVFNWALKHKVNPGIAAAIQISKIPVKILNRIVYDSIFNTRNDLSTAFLWNLLNVHFEMDIFDWNAFANANNLELKMSLEDIKYQLEHSDLVKTMPTNITGIIESLYEIIGHSFDPNDSFQILDDYAK